jgi:hypothetical protein
MKRKLFSKIRVATSLHLIVALLSFLVGGQLANAAAVTSFSDTLTRLNVNTLANQTIQFTTPTGVPISGTIVLTFQSNFVVDSIMTFADMDLATSTEATLANTATSNSWGVATTSSSITFTNASGAAAAVAPGAVITIKIGTHASFQSVGVRQITNPTTSGNKTVAVTGTFGDTGTTTVAIVDNNNDQVSLTAQVNGSITFSVSATSTAFGTLTPGTARYASSTAAGDSAEATSTILTVGTNGATGFTMTLNSSSANQGSLTAGTSKFATSSGNVVPSGTVEQFGVRFQVYGGSNVTVSAPYAASGFAFDSATFPDPVATGTSATANATFSARYVAMAISNTPAGAYSATHTYIATANF